MPDPDMEGDVSTAQGAVAVAAAFGLVLGAASAAYATRTYSTAQTFYGPTTPSGGFYPECANQQGFTDPGYTIGNQHGSGGGHAQSRYSSSGTCDQLLNRPYGYLFVDGQLVQTSTGTLCGQYRGHNSEGSYYADAEISRGLSGGGQNWPCPNAAGYYYGQGVAAFYSNGSYHNAPCCGVGPSQYFAQQNY